MKADLDEPRESPARVATIPSQIDCCTVLDFILEHFADGGLNLKDFLDMVERHLLLRTLSRFEGNQKKTSAFLALKPTTLNAKCKKFQIRFVKQPSFQGSEK